MAELHSQLKRQLMKTFGEEPAFSPELKKLLQLVNEAYNQSDSDRVMLERSLEISSQEHLQSNDQMSKIQQIALGIESRNNINDLLSFVVESARDIPGICFVMVQKLDKDQQYLITPYYSRIRDDTAIKRLKAMGYDLKAYLGISSTSGKPRFEVARIKVVRDYISKPGTIIMDSISGVLEGVWPKTLCDSIQKVFSIKRSIMTPLIVDGKSWGNLLFLLDNIIPTTVLEMISAHCSLGIKNVLTLEDLQSSNRALAESEHKYSLITESTADYISVMTMTGIYTYISPSHKTLGYEAQELLGKSGWDLVHPEDIGKILPLAAKYANMNMQALNGLKNQGYSEMVQFRFLDKRGNWHPMEANASLIPSRDGTTMNILFVSRDLTERKKMAEALIDSQKKYQALVETTSDFIWEIDTAGRYTYCSPQAERLWGFKPAGMIGKTPFNVMPAEYGKDVKKWLDDLNKNPDPFRFENTTFNSRGAMITLEVSGVPFFDNNHKLIGYRGISRDITERKKIEHIKDEFIGMVSHELKTPLTVVIGALAVARNEKLSAEEQREMIESASLGAEELAGMLENLLELSRYQSNRLKIQTEPLEIKSMIRSIINKLQPRATIHTLKNNVPDDIPTVEADRLRIETVLYNLIENGIKYSPDGGEIEINASNDESQVILSVRDHGIGISQENQKKLFRKFERLEAYEQHSISGLGLGLTVCRLLVEAHGGKIWLESGKNEGSTFFFTIPLKQIK